MQQIRASFDGGDRAQAAVQALLDEGFPSDDIHVEQPEGPAAGEEVPVVWKTYARRWSAYAAASGALLGAVLAAVLPQLSVRAERAFEGIISDHIGLAALQGGFLGALALGVVGLMMGIGTWRTTAELKAPGGSIWVGVRTNQGDVERARHALRHVGGRQLQHG